MVPLAMLQFMELRVYWAGLNNFVNYSYIYIFVKIKINIYIFFLMENLMKIMTIIVWGLYEENPRSS